MKHLNNYIKIRKNTHKYDLSDDMTFEEFIGWLKSNEYEETYSAALRDNNKKQYIIFEGSIRCYVVVFKGNTIAYSVYFDKTHNFEYVCKGTVKGLGVHTRFGLDNENITFDQFMKEIE